MFEIWIKLVFLLKIIQKEKKKLTKISLSVFVPKHYSVNLPSIIFIYIKGCFTLFYLQYCNLPQTQQYRRAVTYLEAVSKWIFAANVLVIYKKRQSVYLGVAERGRKRRAVQYE